MVADQEEDRRDGQPRRDQRHRQGDDGVDLFAVAQVQASNNHRDEDCQHPPKVELVHDLLRVLPAYGVQMEGGSMANEIQEHEGDGDQKILLQPARVFGVWEQGDDLIPQVGQGEQGQHRRGDAGHGQLHAQSEGQKAHEAVDDRGPHVVLEERARVPDANHLAVDGGVVCQGAVKGLPFEANEGPVDGPGALAQRAIRVNSRCVGTFTRQALPGAAQDESIEHAGWVLQSDLEPHLLPVERVA
mmetsp:Transcript_22381/g.42199  ORF Transcript_22381/g.42199 Transcript_22381/m.42199 type:complete len:244 (-) Transcript_22381:517-1248(-)